VKILVIRTDKPEAELGIFDGAKQLSYKEWLAGRELSLTLNKEVGEILDLLSISLEDLGGIVIYKGPGSFTGLRIGFSVANALAYSLDIPIVSAGGEGWVEKGVKKLSAGKNQKIALPEYGSLPITTQPKK
jgi:tRNA threonylcarbamoyladenosine biosynthesis protein TsaB